MNPISFYERYSFTPEVMASPSWDGLLFWVILCISCLGYLWKIKTFKVQTIRIWGIILAVCFVAGLIFGFNEINPFLVLSGALSFLFTLTGLIILSCQKDTLPQRKPWILTGIALIFIQLFCFTGYKISYYYYYPNSYPQKDREQLLMIRYLAEKEPMGYDYGKPLVELKDIHYYKNGMDIIPDSLRENNEYKGYRYSLVPDPANKNLFILDAVPINYQKGWNSFHLDCGEISEVLKPNSSYCITMADRKGKPALSTDRHFHHRNIWSLMVNR